LENNILKYSSRGGERDTFDPSLEVLFFDFKWFSKEKNKVL